MTQATFDPATVSTALRAADRLASTPDLGAGLHSLAAAPASGDPIAWVDDIGNVWPHPHGAAVHAHIRYLYTADEVAAHMQQANSIIVAPTAAYVEVPPAAVETTPQDVVNAQAVRRQMLAAFASPVGQAAPV
jgi:hypothetical protein